MIDDNAVVLKQPGKEQIDFRPPMALYEIVNHFSIKVVLRTGPSLAMTDMNGFQTHLVRSHKVP